jgi:hypothetical protein
MPARQESADHLGSPRTAWTSGVVAARRIGNRGRYPIHEKSRGDPLFGEEGTQNEPEPARHVPLEPNLCHGIICGAVIQAGLA